MVHLEFLSVSFAWFIFAKIRFATICRLCNILERRASWLWTMSCCLKAAAEPSTVAFKNQMELPPTVSGRISLLEIQETGCNKWDFILKKRSKRDLKPHHSLIRQGKSPNYPLSGPLRELHDGRTKIRLWIRAEKSERRKGGKRRKGRKRREKVEKVDLVMQLDFWQTCQNAIKCHEMISVHPMLNMWCMTNH